LANFCQDVARDWDLGRIYLPQESCRQFGYGEEHFAARRASESFRRLLQHETERACAFLLAGKPLIEQMPAELRVQVALFVEGGLAILDEIRHQQYDVWRRRPTVSKLRKVRLLSRCWWHYRAARRTRPS
jgi:phytoene/squalene synthetase